MTALKGWRKISHDRGFMNETTGQTVVIEKKEFGEHYVVLLLPPESNKTEDGKKLSPEFPVESKAEAFALDWMKKYPKGIQ
jgi:hypothetical protein